VNGNASDRPVSSPTSGDQTSSTSPLSSPSTNAQDRSLGSPGSAEYTKEYEYDDRPDDLKKKHKGKIPGVTGPAFTYEGRDENDQLSSPETYDKSPGRSHRQKGFAFNYAPGDQEKVRETAERRNKAMQDMALGGGDMSQQERSIGEIVYPTPRPRTPVGTPVTTPEKDKAFDEEQFGNDNKMLSSSATAEFPYLQVQRKTPSPTHLYTPRPWSASSPSPTAGSLPPKSPVLNRSPVPYSRPFDVQRSPVPIISRSPTSPTQRSYIDGILSSSPSSKYEQPGSPSSSYNPAETSRSPPPGMRGGLSSIFSQPGYTTSFLNKPVSPIPVSGDRAALGYQNRSFQDQPLSTSTPMASGNGFREGIPGRQDGDNFSYSTPPSRPYPGSESMITHPGTIHSQLETSEMTKISSTVHQKRVRSDSAEQSASEDDSLHSSSSEDYTENKVPETAELQDPTGMRKSSSRRKGKKGSGKGLMFENKGAISSAPKIVKTTTKQTVVKDKEGVRHDKHERVEDLTPGGSGMVTVSTTSKEV